MDDAPLIDRLRAHCHAARLFREPGGVVVAVSGGADSVALLDLLAALAPEFGLSPCVAHADHGILPTSAGAAAEVAALAARYGLPCQTGRLELGPGASETRARIARYRFLRQVQEERGARWLATAHHADDQAETVLLRMLRGSGPAGLAGIPTRGPRGLVRPLLPFRRAELAAHAQAAGLPVVDDPSNRDLRHTRAWVRTQLLPLIEARLGGAGSDALRSVARHAARDARAWDALLDALDPLNLALAEGRVEVAREALTGYHNVLAERILRAAVRRAGLQLGPRAAARAVRFAARAGSGKQVDLGAGLVAVVAFDRLVLVRGGTVPEPAVLVGASGSARFGPWRVQWHPDVAPAVLAREGWVTWVPEGGGVGCGVRAARAGDRLVPLGGVGHRRVSRLLMEARVPRVDRAGYPVLVREDEPLWVPGVCRGAAAQPAPGTSALRVEVGRA